MSEFLLYYRRPDPTTWVYLSSLLTIGLYFVFHRFWSVRNLDIVLLILLAPGLLMVVEGRRRHLRLMEAESAFVDGVDPDDDVGPLGDPGVLQPDPDGENQNPDSAAEDLQSLLFQSTDATEDKPSAAGSGTTDRGSRYVYSLSQQDGAKAGGAGTRNAGSGGKNQGAGEPLVDVGDPVKPPTIQEETKIPLAAEPDDLDERLEETTLDPNSDESPQERQAKALQHTGFVFVFLVEVLILVRLLIDPIMTRRPLLDPNLTVGGLYFIGSSLFIFMMANVATSTPRMTVWQGPELGPGYALMRQLPAISTRPVSPAVGGSDEAPEVEMDLTHRTRTILAKVLSISAHLAILVALVLIGNRHFGNLRAGVGCVLLYLMLPYTAQYTGRVDHALPAALLTWAVLCYRRPVVAGVFLGLAAGLVYYPLFLLPLWFSFYWQRGAKRFGVAVLVTLTLLVLLLSVSGVQSLGTQLRWMFGLFWPTADPRGIWVLGWDTRWRLPVIVGFIILSFLFAIWPATKNLGNLISCSAALMVAVQFWHGYGGGLFIAWFLPLLLLTIFRPNLQDRTAMKVVHAGAGFRGRLARRT